MTNLQNCFKMCASIGHLPSSYVDSMSYEEQILWLCKFLDEKVLPAVEQDIQDVKDLKEWFSKLDVQDEINKKLDKMADDGTLQDIILNYVTVTKVYDTYELMIEDLNESTLESGMRLKTLGYHSLNDGGNAIYYLTNDSTEKVGYVIPFKDNYSLVLVNDGTINPKQIGAYGDGIHDDLVPIQNAINYGNVTLSKGNYYVSDMIKVPSNRIFDGGNNYLIPNTGKYAIGFQDRTQTTKEVYIQNIQINTSKNEGSNGLYMESGYFIYIDNINIIQLKGNNTVGIKQVNGFNNIIRNSRVYGSTTYNGQKGIEITTENLPGAEGTPNMTNNKYVDLLIQNLTYGIKAKYTVTGNTNIFDNIGFSNNDYCYYIEGYAYPLTISNSRMEAGSKTNPLTGYYLNGSIYADINNLNAYNIDRVFDITNASITLNGVMGFSGTSQTTKKEIVYATNKVIMNNASFYTQTATYTLFNSSALTEDGMLRTNVKGKISSNTTGTLNVSSVTIDTIKLSSNLANCYGFKGAECYVYTDASDDTYVIKSGGNTSQLATQIPMKKNLLYHILMIDTNKFTVIE